MTHWMKSLSAAVFLASAVAAQAGSIIASGPLRVADGEDYSCAVVNAGPTDLSSVAVVVTIEGGGGGATKTCTPLGTLAACTAANTAGSTYQRFCSVTVAGRKSAVRGTFCNTTTGQCVPVQ